MNQEVLNTEMIIRKRTAGKILYNDGEFAEVQLVGIEGDEENLLLESTQIHRCDTDDSPRSFSVGSQLADGWMSWQRLKSVFIRQQIEGLMNRMVKKAKFQNPSSDSQEDKCIANRSGHPRNSLISVFTGVGCSTSTFIAFAELTND